MYDHIFVKQIGLVNYFIKGFLIKIKKRIMSKNIFSFNTITNKEYFIHKWDPSGSEVFLTNCFTDWGNEYLFLNSIKKKEKGLFLDIGCHTGYFSCLFNEYFEKIIGFEPSNKCIEALEIVKKKYSNFNYITTFVGNNEEIIYANDYNTGYAFDINSKNIHAKIMKQVKIPKITIDNFCEENRTGKISGIKIDVDGIDMEILEGAKKIIIKNRPSVLIEHYSHNLIDFFSTLNYNLYSFSSSQEKPYNLKLEKIINYDNNKWVKMICCVPKENSGEYEEKKFYGNYFFGISKNEILKYFNLTF